MPHELLKDIAETCGVQVISDKQRLQGILADIAPFGMVKTKKIILLAVGDNIHKKLNNSDVKNKFASQNLLDREIAGYMVDAFAYALGNTQSIPSVEKSKIERWFSDKTDYSSYEETNKPQPQPHLQPIPEYKPQPQPEYKPPPQPVYTSSTSSKEDDFFDRINVYIWAVVPAIPTMVLVFNFSNVWFWIYGIIMLSISIIGLTNCMDIDRWPSFIIAIVIICLAIGIPFMLPSKTKKEKIEIVETLAIAGEWCGNLAEGNRNIPLELEIIGNSKDSIAARMIIHTNVKVEYEYTVRLEANNLYLENKATSGNYSGNFEGVISDNNKSISGVYKSRNAELKFELSKTYRIDYDNGAYYIGEVENNKPNGKGIYYLANGNRYEGEMKDGNWNGRGILYYTNGDRTEGIFENDIPQGVFTYHYPNGTNERVRWVDNNWVRE